MGLFLISYLVAPAVLLASATGWGLLVLRIASANLRPLYGPPLGFAAMLVTAAFLTTWDATAELTGPALVVGGIAGLVMGRQQVRGVPRRARSWVWPGTAAAAAFMVYISPAMLTGRATFTGYARIVDIAHQFDFARYLVTEGRLRPPARDTSYLEVVTKTLDIGYPSGAQGIFGGFATVLNIETPWIYQGFLGVTAAMAALATYLLLSRVIDNRLLRVLGAGIAPLANMVHGYGLVGGFKELTTASMLLLTAAVARDTLPERVHGAALVPLAISVSACLAALNLTAVPWLGIMLGGLFVVSVARRRLSGLKGRLSPVLAWGVTGLIVLVISAPTVWEALKLAPVAAAASGDDRTALVDLGNLAEPVSLSSASGVWVGGDFRLPSSAYELPTLTGAAIVLVLSALGAIHVVRRREWGMLALAVASIVALAYFTLRTGPWIQLKAIAMSGPVFLALAFAGAGGLVGARRDWRIRQIAGWGLALALAACVLVGNAFAYHNVTVAPTAELRDLEQIGDRFAGQGPTLYPAHNEYAEYFLRDMNATGNVNPPGEGNGFPQILPGASPTPFSYDFDQLSMNWIQAFNLLVVPRNPTASRPPGNFRRVAQTRFHEVWRRVASGSSVLTHVSLPVEPAITTQGCVDLVGQARRSRESARVVVAVSRPIDQLLLGDAVFSPNWTRADAGAVVPYGPGRLTGRLYIEETGAYRVWLQGPNQRRVRVSVDDHQVAEAADEWSYPQHWSLIGTTRLREGPHEIELRREGGSLAPGNGAGGQPIGPLVFQFLSPDQPSLREISLEQAARLCEPNGRLAGVDRDALDWMELVAADQSTAVASVQGG